MDANRRRGCAWLNRDAHSAAACVFGRAVFRRISSVDAADRLAIGVRVGPALQAWNHWIAFVLLCASASRCC